MPFDNQIATVSLTGAQVLEVLENGVGPSTCVQVSGLSFSFDPGRPRGERVLGVTLPGGAPLDPGKTYFVAANDFMAQGGDGYRVFAQGKDLRNSGILVRNAMEKDLERLTAAKQKLAPPPGGRIVNRGAPQAAAASSGTH
jgi:5'-nucleotidase